MPPAKLSKKRPKPAEKVRTCRECGCTDDDCSGCIEATGEPCRWVRPDLCLACYPLPISKTDTGYMVIVSLRGGPIAMAAHGSSEAVQIFEKKAAAMDLRDQMRAYGNKVCRVVKVNYTVRSDGKPTR